MTDDELRAQLKTLQGQGKSVDVVAAVAAALNMKPLLLIQALRDLYGLSLTEASTAASFARHGPKYARPYQSHFEGVIDRVARVRAGEGWVLSLSAVCGTVRVGQRVQLDQVGGGVGVHQVLAVTPSSDSSPLVLTLSGTDAAFRPAVGGKVAAHRRSPHASSSDPRS